MPPTSETTFKDIEPYLELLYSIKSVCVRSGGHHMGLILKKKTFRIFNELAI